MITKLTFTICELLNHTDAHVGLYSRWHIRTVHISLCQQNKTEVAQHSVQFHVLQTVPWRASGSHLAWRWVADQTCSLASMMPLYSTVTQPDKWKLDHNNVTIAIVIITNAVSSVKHKFNDRIQLRCTTIIFDSDHMLYNFLPICVKKASEQMQHRDNLNSWKKKGGWRWSNKRQKKAIYKEW